tara:strand:- start:265 stop:423 length:159 start_codon:yes stop_codon:yes gene_type:complete
MFKLTIPCVLLKTLLSQALIQLIELIIPRISKVAILSSLGKLEVIDAFKYLL